MENSKELLVEVPLNPIKENEEPIGLEFLCESGDKECVKRMIQSMSDCV